jgi:hypothetical protein
MGMGANVNRRNFFKVMGLAGVSSWLGISVKAVPARSTVNPWTIEPRIFNASDAIFTIDPSDMPLLSALGSGTRVKMSDWPSYKVAWVEDTLIPRQPGEPGYVGYTEYIEPFEDDYTEDTI